MWKILFNQKRLKDTRKELRNNMTNAEKKLWENLKWKKILWLKFRRQHSVWRYILDFYCPSEKLCIELDWEIHDETKEYDNIRTEYLNQSDINVLRFSNDEVFENIENVIVKIENHISPPPAREGLGVGDTWSFQDSDIKYENEIIKWINEEVVYQISKANNEPEWLLESRLKALKMFREKELPKWGPDLSRLDLDEIYYYAKPEWAWAKKSWDDVPDDIKNTFDRLWIPEAEKKSLAWVGAQYDSGVVFNFLV